MNKEIEEILDECKMTMGTYPYVRLSRYIKAILEEREELKDKLDIFILSDKTKQETINRLRKTIDELKEGENNE